MKHLIIINISYNAYIALAVIKITRFCLLNLFKNYNNCQNKIALISAGTTENIFFVFPWILRRKNSLVPNCD